MIELHKRYRLKNGLLVNIEHESNGRYVGVIVGQDHQIVYSGDGLTELRSYDILEEVTKVVFGDLQPGQQFKIGDELYIISDRDGLAVSGYHIIQFDPTQEVSL